MASVIPVHHSPTKRSHGGGDNDDGILSGKRQHFEQIPKYADIVLQTDIVLCPASEKDQDKHDYARQQERISEMICALRNSGGGVLQLRITDPHLQGYDKFYETLRKNMTEMVREGELFGDVFDDRGTKHPDYLSLPENERIMEIFVQSSDFLCFLKTHAKEAHEFSIETVKSVGVKTLLCKRDQHRDVHYQNVKFPECPAVEKFISCAETPYREGQSIQLKEIKPESKKSKKQTVCQKLFHGTTRSLVPNNLIGFANNKGGHLFIGVAECEFGKKCKTGRSLCVGVPLTENDKLEIEEGLNDFVKKLKCCPLLENAEDGGSSDRVKYMELRIGEHVRLHFHPVFYNEMASILCNLSSG